MHICFIEAKIYKIQSSIEGKIHIILVSIVMILLIHQQFYSFISAFIFVHGGKFLHILVGKTIINISAQSLALILYRERKKSSIQQCSLLTSN